MSLGIYLASSWRNKLQAEVLAILRADKHEVYDFKNPVPDNAGFSWRQIGDRFGKCSACGEEDPLKKPGWCPKGSGRSAMGPTGAGDMPGERERHQWQGGWDAAYFASHVLDHPVAAQGFGFDMDALDAASACVLVEPCGRSAHLELGYAVGQGKLTVVYFPDLDEPELMIRMCDYVVTTIPDLRKVLSQARPPPRWQRDVAYYDATFDPAGRGVPWYTYAPPQAVKEDSYARDGETLGPCRPFRHRKCQGCKGCWRHGTCTCGPKEVV